MEKLRLRRAGHVPEGMQQGASESVQSALYVPSQAPTLGCAVGCSSHSDSCWLCGSNKLPDLSEFQFLRLFKGYTYFWGLSWNKNWYHVEVPKTGLGMEQVMCMFTFFLLLQADVVLWSWLNNQSYSLWDSQGLAESYAWRRHLINICWMNGYTALVPTDAGHLDT